MDFCLYYDESSWFVISLSRQMGSFSRAVRVSFSWPLRHRTTRTTVRTTPREPIGLPSLVILCESVYVFMSSTPTSSLFKFQPFAEALVVKASSLLFLFYIAQRQFLLWFSQNYSFCVGWVTYVEVKSESFYVYAVFVAPSILTTHQLSSWP